MGVLVGGQAASGGAGAPRGWHRACRVCDQGTPPARCMLHHAPQRINLCRTPLSKHTSTTHHTHTHTHLSHTSHTHPSHMQPHQPARDGGAAPAHCQRTAGVHRQHRHRARRGRRRLVRRAARGAGVVWRAAAGQWGTGAVLWLWTAGRGVLRAVLAAAAAVARCLQGGWECCCVCVG